MAQRSAIARDPAANPLVDLARLAEWVGPARAPHEQSLDRVSLLELDCGRLVITSITAAEFLFGHSSCVEHRDWEPVEQFALCCGYELTEFGMRDGRIIFTAEYEPTPTREGAWLIGLPRGDGTQWYATEVERLANALLWSAALSYLESPDASPRVGWDAASIAELCLN